MIKVLMCGNHPSNKGGMTSVISQLMSYDWKKKNVSMKYISTFYPSNNIVKSGYFMLSYFRILAALIIYKPDIVHMHMSYKGSFYRKFMIHKMCKRFGIKDIIHLHGSEFEKWYNETDKKTQEKIRRLLREADAFFVLGQKWKSIVEKIEPHVNAVVVTNSVPIPKESVSWNKEQCQILYMGVLIPRKGVKNLLEALCILKESDQLGTLKAVIAGTGPEEAELKEYCKKKNLEEIIRFYGWIGGNRKKELILESQIGVLPSYNEGLPVSVLEEISYGMPVIASRVGDIETAVKDGENGCLVDPGVPEQIAEKLKIVRKKDVFLKMSEKSRELAEKEFAEEKFFEKITKYYTKLCGEQDI